MFLPVQYVFTGNQYFSSNSNQKTLDSDLICESVKMNAFQKSRINLLDCFNTDILFLPEGTFILN